LLLALTVAVLAVALGFCLGLAPHAGRRALGPLRTLALTAVVAVVALHLLPEALVELKAVGLGVFALGLAAPRWFAALGAHRNEDWHAGNAGLELGFWGLVIHHLGDGLALGAYVRLEPDRGHRHLDVLLALVLHTVPLVAVVAAGYARTRGPRAALLRSSQLAAASVVGVLLAGSVPAALVAQAQAWIAAGVSGLLLHGLTHDLERDLPAGTLERGLDLLMVFAGIGLGWLGVALDRSSDADAFSVGPFLWLGVERVAPPLAVGLLLGSGLDFFRMKDGVSERAGRGRGLGPETFLLTMTHFGWLFALGRDALVALGLSLAPAASTPEPEAVNGAVVKSRSFRAWLSYLDARVDSVIAWGLVGVLIAAVIGACIPGGALTMSPLLALGLVLVFVLSVPVHAAAAPIVAFVLYVKGLPPGAAMLFIVLGPLRFESFSPRVAIAVALAVLGSFVGGPYLVRPALALDPDVARAIAAVLLTLGLRRAYRLGFRALLRPLLGAEASAAHVHEHAVAR
jgi:hypothetical protein